MKIYGWAGLALLIILFHEIDNHTVVHCAAEFARS